MTYQLDKRLHNGVTYLDTPGLSDINIRKQAAKAITEALKQNGMYQIFFVITLEAGRVRPEDITTMKLVLQSSKDIRYYSIIINKLTKGSLNGLIEDNAKNLITVVTEVIKQIECVEVPPTLLLLSNRSELEDAKDGFLPWKELNIFAKQAPCVIIKPTSVNEINGEASIFEKVLDALVQQIKDLHLNYNRMIRMERDTERRYRKLLEDEVKKRETEGNDREQPTVIFSWTFLDF